MFDSEQKEGSRAVGWPPTELSKSDDLNRLVLAGLTLKSTRRANGARVEKARAGMSASLIGRLG
ncbi:MAG: hypothetical protein WCF55_02265, partial [Pseudolabrys sp.]